MAELQVNNQTSGRKKRAKKQSTRVDMTPMVDLAFLLLTFFVLTATFSKPKSMELAFPTQDGEPSALKNGITFLLGANDRIFYYEGEFRAETTVEGQKTILQELSFAQNEQQSLHNYLLAKNKTMQEKIITLDRRHATQELSDEDFKIRVREAKRDPNSPTYLVKTDELATYANVIDLVDELNINVVGKYVMSDAAKQELDLLHETIAGNEPAKSYFFYFHRSILCDESTQVSNYRADHTLK